MGAGGGRHSDRGLPVNVRPTVVQDVHLVPRSGNSKTGPLPVTYRPMSTCPTDCPFLPGGQDATQGGCYGTGRLFASAQHRSTTLDVEAGVWRVRLGKDATARYLRDRVVGDVLTPAGDVDRDYLTAKAAALITRMRTTTIPSATSATLPHPPPAGCGGAP